MHSFVSMFAAWLAIGMLALGGLVAWDVAAEREMPLEGAAVIGVAVIGGVAGAAWFAGELCAWRADRRQRERDVHDYRLRESMYDGGGDVD